MSGALMRVAVGVNNGVGRDQSVAWIRVVVNPSMRLTA